MVLYWEGESWAKVFFAACVLKVFGAVFGGVCFGFGAVIKVVGVGFEIGILKFEMGMRGRNDGFEYNNCSKNEIKGLKSNLRNLISRRYKACKVYPVKSL